jgi:peptidyl-prolyl cis-trans isomerase D
MLKSMRDSFHHLKWILLAVVAAFIIGFVYVDMGLGGARTQRTEDRSYAARVNGETVTYGDYNRALYFAEENYKRMYGGQFTPEMAEAMGLNRQVLDSLIDQRLLLQEAKRLHLAATPEEVRRKILSVPILNPDGKFVGAELYTRFVQQNGYASAAEFEDELGRQITLDKIESAIMNSVVVSPKAADEEYRRTAENAKIRYILYPASRDLAGVTVTPAEVEAYYKSHPEKYSHGEQRNLKYLIADLARLRSQIVPSEKDLRDRYEAAKSEYTRPESAHILHILIKVDPNATPEADAAARARAESLVRQLKAGADFAKLARENSQDPSSSSNGGDMGFIDRGATVEPFDQAAFTIPLNTISDPPIRSKEYGYHIIKVVERRPGGTRPFEEVRAQVASNAAMQMAQDQARDEIARVSAKLKEKKPSTPAEFSAIASDKVTSNETQWFQNKEAIPGLGFNQPLTTWAFAAKQGDISEVIGTQRGPAIAYVAGIRPAGVTALEEVRQRVENDAKLEKARALAQQKLAAAMAGVPAIDAVAAKVGLTAQETSINRQGYVTGIPGDTSALVDQVMSSQIGQVKGPVAAGDGVVAFQVIDQKKVTPAELAQNRASYLDMVRQREARSLRSSLLQRLRKSSNVEVNTKVLEQAHGSANT